MCQDDSELANVEAVWFTERGIIRIKSFKFMLIQRHKILFHAFFSRYLKSDSLVYKKSVTH
ncbi:hypothetical protein FGJ02_00835 [Shigella flexneri]|nr:hypothetical protein [Shigella flexneri]